MEEKGKRGYGSFAPLRIFVPERTKFCEYVSVNVFCDRKPRLQIEIENLFHLKSLSVDNEGSVNEG